MSTQTPPSTPSTPPDHNQYGLKDPGVKTSDVYANRAGGEQSVTGPKGAVTAGGHRVGAIEAHPDPKPSSRAGQAVFGETDNKQR